MAAMIHFDSSDDILGRPVVPKKDADLEVVSVRPGKFYAFSIKYHLFMRRTK